ncbi:MAG: winged helix-turn-helix domain-containing protein [Coprococcus sp.]
MVQPLICREKSWNFIYLMENRKRVVSRDELLVNIWGYDYDGRTRVVDDHIRKLRKALARLPGK